MRLPFPERIPLLPVAAVCLLLFLVQQLQGTTLLFSAGTAAFILVSTVAFNVSGGFTRPSGGFIACYAIVAVIMGIVYKVVVNEPAQSNLQRPDLTIEVYVGSIVAMLGAAFVARRLTAKKSLLPGFTSDTEMYRACIGCLVVGSLSLSHALFGWGSGGGTRNVIDVLANTFAFFLPLSVLLGVTYEIRKSGGRRSVSPPVVIGILMLLTDGILNYSKQGMLSPYVCWLIPAAASRYKVSLLQVAGMLVALSFTLTYLVPYSQYGRSYRDPDASFSENLKVNLLLLSNLTLVREVYQEDQAERYAETEFFRYYNQPQGIMDRAQMVTPDDAIIDLTASGAVYGLFPTLFSFENLIPHFIWPEKPSIGFGNLYARELGILPEEDEDTQISFSPSGDAFHQAKWTGVFVVLPLLCLMLFVVMDSLCGDTRASPFALLPVLGYVHAAPEGGLLQFVPLTVVGFVLTYAAAYIGVRVLPLAADLIVGRPRAPLNLPPVVRFPGGRLSAPPAPDGSVTPPL